MTDSCQGIAYPYIDPTSGHRKHVGDIPCGETPTCELCYTLDVLSNLGNVPIMVDPSDDFGRGNGNTDFQRVYSTMPGVTVHLLAPQTHMGLNFRYWRLDGENQALFSLALDVLLDGTKCREAVAIYGNVFPYGGCGGPGCEIDLPEWITISGWYTQLGSDDPANCPGCHGDACNSIWSAVRHSALARAGPEEFGSVGWTSGFPNGPGDPQTDSPSCDVDATGCVGGGVGYYCCPDECPGGASGCHYFVPCGAEFYARLQCICDPNNEQLIARVAGGLGFTGARFAPNCPGVPGCSQDGLPNSHFVGCGANNEPGKDFVVGHILNSIDCCNQADKILGAYQLDIWSNPFPGNPCNRQAIGRVSFTI